jgi:hypothetical protein
MTAMFKVHVDDKLVTVKAEEFSIDACGVLELFDQTFDGSKRTVALFGNWDYCELDYRDD